MGQFDVFVGDDLVASKQKKNLLRQMLGDKGFPDEDAAVAAVEAKLG